MIAALLSAHEPITARAQSESRDKVLPLASTPAALAFHGVTVIDVRGGRLLPGRTVVVVGTRIQAVEPTGRARLPKGTQVVDASGKYLIPGLWDMHVHPMQYTDIAYPLFVANGVTGVRDAGSDVPLATLSQWKREIAAGTRVGPRLLVSGPAMYEASNGQEVVTHDSGSGASQFINVPLALATRVVDSLHAAGADFIKTYSMSPAMYMAIAAEARRVGVPFGGHLPDRDGGIYGREASDSGATFLDHQTWFAAGVCGTLAPRPDASTFDTAQCAAGARHLRRNNTWVPLAGPTAIPSALSEEPMTALHASLVARGQPYTPNSVTSHEPSARDAGSHAVIRYPTSAEEWALTVDSAHDPSVDAWLSVVSKMHAAGIPVVPGTDANYLMASFFYAAAPGFSLHEWLIFYTLAGATPLEALRAATLDPALAVYATDSLGTVEAGKVADLVLLDADPLADVWNTTKIRAVVANGRYYDRAALDRLLAEVRAKADSEP